MASEETDHLSPEERASKLNELLQSRKDADSKPAIVEKSYEKASLERTPSADADCLSRKKKEEKLNEFLKQSNMKRRRKRRRKLTVNDVKAEAARILEEFLQAQLHQQEIQTTSPEERYQRYVETNVTEETTPSPSSSGYLASHSGILRENSIPYADDSEHELVKAESLPHDDFMEKYLGKANDTGLEIHHAKSKSAPFYGNDDDMYIVSPKSSKHKPPPPPPPGTPHTPSEQGSTELISQPVPYQGKSTDSSVPCSIESMNTSSLERHLDLQRQSIHPKVPTTLDLPKPIFKSRFTASAERLHDVTSSETQSRSSTSPSKSSTLPAKKRKESGFASSDSGDDSSYHDHLSRRKKKSVFKKAQERLQTFLRNRGHHSPESEHSDKVDNRQKVIKKKNRKTNRKKPGGDDVDMINRDDREVLEDRHIHTKKHVHQTHIGENGQGVYRTEHVTKVVDIDSSSGKKHIKKEWNVKESTDSEKGFMGRIRRLTSRDKKHVKGSKSMNIAEAEGEPPVYCRTLSLPQYGVGDTKEEQHVTVDDSDGFSVTEIERSAHGNTEEIHASQVVSRRHDDIKRHSSHLDIVDHTGAMVERIFFDPEEENLPRNKSFDYVSESNIHETRIREHGKVRVIRDVDTHDHMSVAEDDVETDGNSDDQRRPTEMSEMEKEELYGKIAERLAMIGDNLTVEREVEMSRSAVSSPGHKLSTASGGKDPSTEAEVQKKHLTQLETEIRDELRLVADEIDARLAADARQAAMRIAGIVTYNHFKNVVQDTVGNEVGWAQVAAVFNITKRAIQLAGASGALAMQIKEMSLRYIEDTFANWIVAKGGWDSMLSDNEDDEDENYSDVD